MVGYTLARMGSMWTAPRLPPRPLSSPLLWTPSGNKHFAGGGLNLVMTLGSRGRTPRGRTQKLLALRRRERVAVRS